jgi:hypothetical protein
VTHFNWALAYMTGVQARGCLLCHRRPTRSSGCRQPIEAKGRPTKMLGYRTIQIRNELYLYLDHHAQRLIELGIIWGFGVTLLRGLRRPNDWAEAHWLISYDFGLLKRALPGTLLKPFTSSEFGARNAEFAISLLSFLITAVVCLVLLKMALTILRNNEFATNAVLVIAAFVTSPFIVMSGHLNGYFDAQIILLSGLAVLLVLRDRLWAAAIALTIGLFIHETIFVIGFPSILLAVLIKSQEAKQPLDPPQTAKVIGHYLIPFLLPAVLFSFLFWYQSFFFDATALEHVLTEYLRKFPFIQYDQEVIVPRAYTRSFVAYFQTQGPRFWGRLLSPQLLVSILPNLLVSLVFTRQILREWHGSKSVTMAALLLPFLPLSLHLIAWDTSRIWTYPLIVALLTIWTICKAIPKDDLGKTDLLLLSVACLIVIGMNIFNQTPLMDWRVERFSPGLRLLLYLPLLLAVATIFSRRFGHTATTSS